MKSSKSLRQLADLQPGDHLCFLYETDEEHQAVLTSFLCRGLELHEKVLYLADPHSAEVARRYLEDVGVEVGTYLASGQFLIFKGEAWTLNPEELVAFLRRETDKALEDGYRALRVATEMAWIGGRIPGAERLIEFEAGLNNLLPGIPCLALCQYDRRRFDPAFLLDILAAHPHALVDTRVMENIYYLPPRELLGQDPVAVRLTKSLNKLMEWHQVTENLQKQTHDLGERVKELNCLFGIFSLVEKPGNSLEEILQGVVDLIPPAWQYPEITCARLVHTDMEFRTKNFRETPWRQSSDIIAHGENIGLLEVFYQEERPESDEGPFLKEERHLIDAIAGRLRLITERQRADEVLKRAHEELERRVEERTAHLKQANEQLLREVKERQQIEERLRESEVLFLAFMQHLPGTALIRDLQGRYLFVNEGWEKALGKEKADWQGKTLEEIWPVDIACHFRELDKRAILTRQTVETVITFTLEDGPHAWLINRFPIMDKDNQPVMVGAAGIDITARCAAEEALYREKEKYQILAEKSPLGISIISKDGKYRYLNPKFIEIFGYTLEDIPTGREWFTRAYPTPAYRRRAETTWINDLKHSRPGELRPRTFTVTCKDGSQKIINFRSVSLERGDQIIIYEDITERLKAEETIRENERRFRQLVEHAGDALFLHDKGRIIEVNQQACQSLGYTREELLNMSILDIEESIDPQALHNLWQQELKTPITLLGTHRRKNGSTFPVEVKVGDFDYDGRRLRLALARDITARVLAEEALRQSEIKYRTLVEAAPLGISIIAQNGRYIYINPKFEEKFGYTLKDIPTGREWFAKAFPDSSYRQMVITDWIEEAKAPQIGEIRPRAFRVKCKDGAVKMINFRLAVLPTGDWLIFYEDITERVQAQEALAESEEKYRLLVNQIPAEVYKGYADGKVDFLDHKIESLTGYKKEDFDAGRLKWTDLILPEDAPAAREALLKALKGNRSYVREYRIRKQNGDILWIQGRGQIFCDAAGKIDYISGVLFDISEHKRVEEALRQSEIKYRTLVEQIPAVTYIAALNKPSTTMYVSPQIEAILGFTPTEFANDSDTWEKQLHPHDHEWVLAEVARCQATGKQLSSEYRMVAKDGRMVWFHDEAWVVRDANGKSLYLQGVMLDISARKQAEEALKESERLYRLLAENVTDVIWTANLNLEVTYISPSIQLLRGFNPEEVRAQRLEDFMTPDSLQLTRNIFAEEMILENLESRDWCWSRTVELELTRKDGSSVWTETKANFLRDAEGRPVGILGITRDISKRKQDEEALRRREAVLEAVSFAAEKFLQATSWKEDIQEITGRLGQAIQASRVYIFENCRSKDGLLLTSQRYEWVASGISPQINNPELQNLPWRAAGFGRWEENLSQGSLIFGDMQEFPPSEQKLLAAQDIKSIVAVPIFVGQQWWGIIGFEECRHKREWTVSEMEALKAAASTLGAAIQHEQAEKALRESEENLRSLTNQLLSAQENERKRLAAELHDELGHSLLTLKLRLNSLEKQLLPQQKALKKDLKQILQDVGETIEDVRRLYLNLSPGDLEDLGLTGALRAMMEDFIEVNQGITWLVKLDNLDNLFPAYAQTAIYRIVQEALTNIGKHAKAKHISLVAVRENQRVSFNIEDDGKGFDRDEVLASKKTLGLLAMEERVKILDGSFELWSQKKRGTRISFTIPVSGERG